MATNVDLAPAIELLFAAINGMPKAAPTSAQVFDPFVSSNTFDLSSRSSAAAYASVSAPLDDIWDGDTSTFPSFVVSLRIRAREGGWDAPGTKDATTGVVAPNPTNITDVTDKNILINYYLVTDAEIIAASTVRTNNRAMQNTRQFFQHQIFY